MPDGSLVVVAFTPSGRGKTILALEHSGLPSTDQAARSRAFWAERLARLARVMS